MFRFRQESIHTFPVRAVITGVEHSGTTLLSMLLKQDAHIASGFECGFLLADRPSGFKDVHPWYEWMQEPAEQGHWGVTPEHMESVCSSESWREAYQKLIRYSPVFDRFGAQQVIDKTPRYLSCLDGVLDKLPDFVPCIVIEKDVESLWQSHKKRNAGLAEFCECFRLYNNGLRRALAKHGQRIYRVKYAEMCTDLDKQLRNIYAILDLPYKPEYASTRQGEIEKYYKGQLDKNGLYPEQETLQLARLQEEFADLFG